MRIALDTSPDAARSGSKGADGRHARSQRSRRAIARAMLELVRKTQRIPAIDDVAQHAGMSRRTVFRHYEDLNALNAAVIALQQSDIEERFPLPARITGPLDARIAQCVAYITSLYAFIDPVRRVAISLRGNNPAVAAAIRRDQERLRDIFRCAFDPEFKRLDDNALVEMLAGLEVMASWHAWNCLTVGNGLPVETAKKIIARGITGLLKAGSPPD